MQSPCFMITCASRVPQAKELMTTRSDRPSPTRFRDILRTRAVRIVNPWQFHTWNPNWWPLCKFPDIFGSGFMARPRPGRGWNVTRSLNKFSLKGVIAWNWTIAKTAPICQLYPIVSYSILFYPHDIFIYCIFNPYIFKRSPKSLMLHYHYITCLYMV